MTCILTSPPPCRPFRLHTKLLAFNGSATELLRSPRPTYSTRCRATRTVTISGGTQLTTAPLKAALLEAVARANTATQPVEQARLQSQVEELAGQLSQLNPTSNPASSPLISGRWALLYTGRSAVLAPAAFGGQAAADSLSGVRQALQAASDRAYQFFYRYFPLIAGSAVGRRSGSRATNIQIIDLEGGHVDNIARFKLGSGSGEICVSGEASVVPSHQTGGRAVRLRVTFREFELKLGEGPRIALPLSWLSPVGFVETLFLDEQVRISVGDKGSLFVVVRLGTSGVAGWVLEA